MSTSSSGPGDVFDVRRIRRLVELMREFDLSTIDLRQGEQRVRLRRGAEPMISVGPAASMAPVAPTVPAATPKSESAAAAGRANVGYVTSPMVGTFYTSPSPEAPTFVKIGDMVGPETTVCIIEAMKVFNEIPAEVSGRITSVLVENGDPVEYGQRLFEVELVK